MPVPYQPTYLAIVFFSLQCHDFFATALSNMGVYGSPTLKPTMLWGTASGPQQPSQAGLPIGTPIDY